MFSPLKALIFDMDGVLIDSEPLWRRAMTAGFGEAGLHFTDEDCRKTTGMRFKEVVDLWFEHYKVEHIQPGELHERVLQILVNLILHEGRPIPGALEILNYAREKKLKLGLATSSAQMLLNAVLTKLGLQNSFDAAVSAEKMTYGKPHPEVFITCASLLGIRPQECIVIEDSLNGVIAARAAQARVFAVPDREHWLQAGFAVADWKCRDMHEVLRQFKEMV